MTKPTKRKSPILITAILALAVLAIVFGTKGLQSFLEHQEQFSIPAATANERVAKLEKLGIQTKGETHPFHSEELIGHYESTAWETPRQGDETPEIALAVLNEGAEWDRLAELAKAPAESAVPDAADFINKRNSVASKRVAGSLRIFTLKAIEDGRVDDAVRGMEMLSALQQAVVRDPSEAAAIYWYGVNSDLLRNMADLTESKGMTPELRARLKKLVDPNMPVVSVKGLVTRYGQEMVLFAQKLPQATDEEKDILEFMTQRPFPDLKEQGMAAAIKGRLAQVFIDLMEKSDFTKEPEALGYDLDNTIERAQKKGERIKTDYLVAAIPQRFEQLGRMIARIMEARAVMNVILDGDFTPGSKEIMVAGFPQTVVVAKEEGRTTVVCKGIDRHGYYKNQNGLEISQELGVRYFVP